MLISHPSRSNCGFTLVEILIVVVIISILAAIVVPRFVSAADPAAEASVRTTLKAVRGQIQIYRMQHNGDQPSSIQDLIDAEGYLMYDPNANPPPGFIFEYDADTGAFTAACTASYSNCPADVAEW